MALGAASPACDPPYDPPCRVTSAETVDTGIPSRGSLRLTREGFTATFLEVGRDLDAGAAPWVAAFHVVDVGRDGRLARQARLGAPTALRERRGGIGDLGVVARATGAPLFYWVETTTSTEPDGRRATSAALSLAFEGALPFSPEGTSCAGCSLAAVAAETTAGAVVILRFAPERPLGTLGPAAPPTFMALRVTEGAPPEVVNAPWLAPLGSLPVTRALAALEDFDVARGDLAIDVDALGRYQVRTDGSVFLADPSFDLLAGPIRLPSADGHVAFGAGRAPRIAFSVGPYEEGRSTDENDPRDVFVSRSGARERVSAGRLVLGMAQDDDGAGSAVVFESAGRTLFAWLDENDRKRGGDVVLREGSLEGNTIGVPPERTELRVLARGRGTYASVELGVGTVRATQVTCGQ